MTCIAWDGTTLAADRRCSVGSYIFAGTKVRRIRDSLVAVAGNASKVGEFHEWYEQGAVPERYPKHDDGADHFTALVICPGPVILRYEQTAYPYVVEEQCHAMGSGRDYAAAAMHLGKTAAEAVAIAAVFDECTGNGVDTLTLEAS